MTACGRKKSGRNPTTGTASQKIQPTIQQVMETLTEIRMYMEEKFSEPSSTYLTGRIERVKVKQMVEEIDKIEDEQTGLTEKVDSIVNEHKEIWKAPDFYGE